MAVPIHLRDAQYPKQALHYHWAGFQEIQLTDDISKVTCKTCLRMMKRAEKYLGGTNGTKA